MKITQPQKYIAALLALIVTTMTASAQQTTDMPKSIMTPDRIESRLGTLNFKDGVAENATAQKLFDEIDYVHAFDAFVNGYAAVNQLSLLKGFRAAGVNDNDVLVTPGLMDSKSLFLTANADTYYFWAYLDLTKGPLVIETPPDSLGIFDDMWWNWIGDFGFPGPDRGQGGKYLLLPPGYNGDVPEGGYYVRRSRTTYVALVGRAFLQNNDPKPVDEVVKKTLKIYPYVPGGEGSSIAGYLAGKASLGALAKPASPRFVEGTGKMMNTVPPADFSYFEMLNEAVQMQAADVMDPEIAGQLAAIGIVKGKPFNPDARMKKILAEALVVGNAAMRTMSIGGRPSEGFGYYGADSQWINGLWVGGHEFMTPPAEITKEGLKPYPSDNARKLNARMWFFYSVTGITPAMAMRLPNVGSQYLENFRDSQGNAFDGSKAYKVTLPPNIPAAKFWSFTVYDNQSRSMLDTPQHYPRAGSQTYPSPAAKANADGSTTVYFAPTQPAGVERGNWIQTDPKKGWWTILRLYSPLESFFDKRWRPGEIELVK
ncbi:MAG TPA: DUF1254 domain-containing protein [Edaphobacter sp.]|jgi:hypothetical protein|nr:DUF1254 domain-containing protein [Edaphobacter sp.]